MPPPYRVPSGSPVIADVAPAAAAKCSARRCHAAVELRPLRLLLMLRGVSTAAPTCSSIVVVTALLPLQCCHAALMLLLPLQLDGFVPVAARRPRPNSWPAGACQAAVAPLAAMLQ
jgi:hypothetical protein